MTYDAMCVAALLIHETEYRLSGERYASEREMEMIRQDPLAFDDQIRDMLVLATGHVISSRHDIRPATMREVVEAAWSAHEGWRYAAGRAERLA